MAPNSTVSKVETTELPVITSQNEKNSPCEPIDDEYILETEEEPYTTTLTPYNKQFKWANIIVLAVFHITTVVGLTRFPYLQNWKTVVFTFTLGCITGFGVTAGAHRLWTHRSYKARLPLRIFLMFLHTMAGHNSIYDWVRDHRVHHKFSETDADPHNAKRGFFFAHVGWLCVSKHPAVTEKGRTVDMSDVMEDPVVRFNHKHFLWMQMITCFIGPSLIPHYFWNESWTWSILSQCFARFIILVNITWLVNSAAHLWGFKPYDKNIGPVENKTVSFFTIGEGWHNYHHTFPWDYKAAELPNYFNVTTFWLNLLGKVGLAYDFKHASPELVRKVIEKSGDGTHFRWGHTVIPESAELKLRNLKKSN